MTVEYQPQLIYFQGQKEPVNVCWCLYCETEWHNRMDDIDPDGWVSRISRQMVVCKSCGSKRCPKATYHGHECTKSNEPGQPLSVYGGFKLPNARAVEYEEGF